MDGRFRGLRRLTQAGGNGAFSLVFTAVDDVSGREVVIKCFHPDHRAGRYRLDSFAREAFLLGELAGQPDIIQRVGQPGQFTVPIPTALGVDMNVPFEYYGVERAYGTVADLIGEGQWNYIHRLDAFRSMCRAVQRLHSLGVVHRDLKPDNFLVVAPGCVKASDFGTARVLNGNMPPLHQNYATFWPGDTRYTAPEIIAGALDQNPSAAIVGDIYSLGSILFEILTGYRLSAEVYGSDFAVTLSAHMGHVPSVHRARVYDLFIGAMSDAYLLPDLSRLNSDLPHCIRARANTLYRGLAALDYRARLTNFERIFQAINICTQSLRREANIQRRTRFKRRLPHPPLPAVVVQ